MNNTTQQPLRMQLPTGLPQAGVIRTIMGDGSVVSVVFDALLANSQPNDQTLIAEASILDFEIPLATVGSGQIRVEAQGVMATVGSHSWVHAIIWVNGQRMVPISNSGEAYENFYAALCVDVAGKSAFRVSVTLIAQREMVVSGTSAQIALDTLDFSVLYER